MSKVWDDIEELERDLRKYKVELRKWWFLYGDYSIGFDFLAAEEEYDEWSAGVREVTDVDKARVLLNLLDIQIPPGIVNLKMPVYREKQFRNIGEGYCENQTALFVEARLKRYKDKNGESFTEWFIE